MPAPSAIRLGEAIEDGDDAAVRSLLAKGVDPEGFGERWREHAEALGGPCEPPLFLAAWEGHPGIVRLLVAAGADVEVTTWSIRLLRKTRESFFTDACSPLVAACGRGHRNVVAELVAAGADAGRFFHRSGRSGLTTALRGGHHQIVTDLVKRHAVSLMSQVDVHGDELIRLFLSEPGLEMFPWAIEHGLLRGRSGRQVDEHWCEFHLKRRENAALVARLRSMGGIDTLIPADTGVTQFFIACQAGWIDAATALADAGADLNPASEHGSPLTAASSNGRLEMVEWLIERGGSPLLSAAGPEALKSAADLGEKKIARYLKKRLATA